MKIPISVHKDQGGYLICCDVPDCTWVTTLRTLTKSASNGARLQQAIVHTFEHPEWDRS